MKKFLLLIMTIFSVNFSVFAQTLPANCKAGNFKFIKLNLILNIANHTNAKIFLFHNITATNFWLDHQVTHPSASAGWGSKLDQNNWSALLLNNKNSFVITCSQIQPGNVKHLPCRKFLNVCELKNVSLKKTSGSYWLAENQSLPILLKILQQRGVSGIQ